MRKHIAIALIFLVAVVMVALYYCSPPVTTEVSAWLEHMPASWGKYKINTVVNEVLLSSVWTPTEPLSGCGLSDNDFIKYATSKINHEREFQFIVFTDGKPLVGERCLRKAFIFYLK